MFCLLDRTGRALRNGTILKELLDIGVKAIYLPHVNGISSTLLSKKLF